VREQAELTILLGKHRIGTELEKAPVAMGTRGQLAAPAPSASRARRQTDAGRP
jgi:hypothetical protein